MMHGMPSNWTASGRAEANNHFVLMDRLVQLGGRGHGLHQKKENVPLFAGTSGLEMVGVDRISCLFTLNSPKQLHILHTIISDVCSTFYIHIH